MTLISPVSRSLVLGMCSSVGGLSCAPLFSPPPAVSQVPSLFSSARGDRSTTRLPSSLMDTTSPGHPNDVRRATPAYPLRQDHVFRSGPLDRDMGPPLYHVNVAPSRATQCTLAFTVCISPRCSRSAPSSLPDSQCLVPPLRTVKPQPQLSPRAGYRPYETRRAIGSSLIMTNVIISFPSVTALS